MSFSNFLAAHPYTISRKVELAVTSGQTISFQPGADSLLITNPSTVAALTINLPNETNDYAFRYVMSISAITALTFSPAVPNWTNGSTLTAVQGIKLIYSVPLATWIVALS